ncbi:MAG: Xaa-Pro peptidase family protein [Acidobacteria bacterium]|nr:Xaa-Pro peptidase family protein [Acidobacteriota bacterium]MCI0719641.1 Xaa-Pro peptidase family protein [Acidobacteriota bacterium]
MALEKTSQPGIPAKEYVERLRKLRVLMKEQGLAALLLGTGVNLAYFSGYPSPSRSGSRPFFLVLPLEGEAVFIVQTGRREEALRFSACKDVRDYSELSKIPVQMIIDALRERGALRGPIGMELGIEQSFDLPYLEFQRLRSALGSTRLEDASQMLWKLRMTKSQNEAACIRCACQVLAGAYIQTFTQAREGMTEHDIALLLLSRLDAAGIGDRFLALTSDASSYDLPSKPAGARAVCTGDMVWIDAGSTIGGYWSDFSRAGVVGGPSPQQASAQAAIHQITWEAVSLVRPGISVSEVARFCNRKVAELPFAITQDISGRAGRCGHGLGLNLTELPHISETDQTILEAGMVITIEPGVATAYGTFHVEENVLVTSTGCEVLSEASRQLWSIAGK